MSEKKQSNHSALSTKMGDVYHYYVAIDLLLSISDQWHKCLIEESGDIVLLNKDDNQIFNIEVKHHIEDNELMVHNIDFQKTLFNWFQDKNKYTEDTRLILFTTSTISDTNPLYDWNKLSSKEKYQTIVLNSRNNKKELYKNIENYFKKIKNSNNIVEIRRVLAKFTIINSSPNIRYIRDEIKSRDYFRIFRNQEEKKEKVIDSLYGLIGRGLKDKDTWEITKNDFDQKLKELTVLVQDKILRTDTDIDIEKIDMELESYRKKLFIKKLDNIGFDENIFQSAIDDYAKTIIEVSERMDLSNSLEYDKRLETYEYNLSRLVSDRKNEYKYKSGLKDIEKSQQSYFCIMQSARIPFMPQEFDDQTTFFQNGYLHILADDEDASTQICWSLKSEDLL